DGRSCLFEVERRRVEFSWWLLAKQPHTSFEWHPPSISPQAHEREPQVQVRHLFVLVDKAGALITNFVRLYYAQAIPTTFLLYSVREPLNARDASPVGEVSVIRCRHQLDSVQEF